MAGCCGQGPVIVSGAAAVSRVDVETVLLCDVLPDGTVAGLALVEPVYDTTSGDRVGTRIVDPSTGAPYTPTGVLGVCGDTSPECARQISTRARCDDADGDGTGEVTYVEVWALDPCDGGAPQLLGSFLDGDFAAPYTPVAPVDCPDATADTPVVLGQVCYQNGPEIRTAAVLKCAACGDPAISYLDVETGDVVTAPVVVPCPAAAERGSQVLCDVQPDGTSTPFLRTFTDDGTTVTAADTQLDGTTAYTVTGTVGVCLPANDCASPTTPTATVGLCLADGTPIAVTVIRDCDGAVSSEGWINLLTGAYSAGAAPAGTVACGSSQSIQLSGTFCDVDPGTGDVLGLVLIEYSYDADGAIDSVRLVDAVTGSTYTPAGTVTVCPAGVEQPDQDLVPLCDVAGDGTTTQFVRDFRRDETGAIVGHSDYTLAGGAYTPTGTVGLCVEPCTTTTSLVLCDSAAVDLGPLLTFTDTSPVPYYQPPPEGNVKRPNLAAGQPYWDGGSVTFAPPPGGEGTGSSGTHRYIAALIGADAVECPPCGPAGDVTITATGRACNQGPVLGVQTCGRWRLMDGSTVLAVQTLSNVGASGNFPSCRDLSVTATVPYDTLLSGNLALVLDLETHDENGGEKTWIADQFAVTATLAPTAGCGEQFLRTIRAVCSTGAVLSVTDTALDGTTPYAPSGDVGQCTPHTSSCGGTSSSTEPCRNSSTVLVCDVPAASSADIPTTIVDSNVAAVAQTQFQNHAGPYTPLWTGGTLAYPAGPGPAAQHLAATGQITADVSGCDGASGSLTISVRVRNNGPDAGQAWDGALRLFRGTTAIATDDALTWAPVSWQGTLTVSAPVTAADIAAGDIRVALILETYHLGAKSWTADQFDATLELEGCEVTSSTQFLRTLVTDCETGTVVSTTDTTLDGDPYTVTGDVGQCTPIEPPAECRNCEAVVLCDTAADGTSHSFLRTVCRDCTGAVISVLDTELDGTAPYGVTGTVGRCCDTTVLAECTYSLPDTITALSLTDPAYPGCWLGTGGAATYAYGDRVTSWAATYLSDSGSASIALFSSPDLGGAIDFTAFTPALPVNPAQSAPAYTGTAVINGVTVTLTATAGNGLGIWQANNTGLYLGGDDAFRLDFSEPVRLTVNASGFADPPSLHERFCGVTAATVPWSALRLADCQGVITIVDADTREAIPATATLDCADAVETCSNQVIERCGCDDTDGDGIADTSYTELWAIDPCNGAAPLLLGTYENGDLAQPYTPVAPVDCEASEVLAGEPLLLCDTAGAFLRHVRYNGAGEPVSVLDTAVDGTTPYTAVGAVGSCAGASGADAAVNTGLNRLSAAGTFDVKAAVPGLQSATVTVLAGTAQVTTSSGTVTVPAGLSLTWSVSDSDDSSLAVLSVTAPAGADVVTNYTYKAGAAG